MTLFQYSNNKSKNFCYSSSIIAPPPPFLRFFWMIKGTEESTLGFVGPVLDCKTVRIFAYSSTREQSNKRCGTRLKTESETTPYGRVRLARFARIRLLRHALPISLLILRKKPTVLQSSPVPKERTLNDSLSRQLNAWEF